jgi:hypothetical protein
VTKVHLTARHQPCQDAERIARSLSFQNVVNVSMGEHDATSMQL